MKKILLALAFGIAQWSNAQLTCAAATAVTAGSQTSPQITGTYIGTCAGSGAATTPNALYYTYTATANGEVTISSNLPTNDGVAKSDDTRVSILSGTCAALSCYAGNDDIDEANNNYLSEVTFPVSAGTTYFIMWDDRWSDLGFDWTLTFNAVSCIRPNAYSFVSPSNVTANSATVSWSAAIGNPSSYDVQYGVSGFTLGSGTIVNTTTTSKDLSSLTSGANIGYYVRSNCGASQSAWVGPSIIYLAKSSPYTNSFEAPDYDNGFTSTSWSLGNATGGAQNGTIYYFSNSSTTAATNAQLYSRALSLSNGDINTLTFYTRLGSATGTANNLKVYYNTTKSLTGATLIGTAISVSGTTYTLQTKPFSVPTTGIYYLIFSNETPIVTTATSLRLDNINLSSVLGTSEVSLDNTLAIYPNPASDVLNIKTKGKVKSITVYDLSGRRINAEVVDNKVDVKNFQSGTYLIDIETTLGKSSQKFIKK